MSPRRRVHHTRPVRRTRGDYLRAAIAVVAVVVGTILTIWLIRPGGAAAEQPRIAIVITVTVVAFLIAFGVSRTPHRPVVGRLTLWGAVGIVAVLAVSVGAILEEVAEIDWALRAGFWTAGLTVAATVFGEAVLLVRRWSQGSLALGLGLSLALALLCGAATTLIWGGDLQVDRVESVPLPLIPESVTPPPVSSPFPSGIPGLPPGSTP